jgi:hypothetical protein
MLRFHHAINLLQQQLVPTLSKSASIFATRGSDFFDQSRRVYEQLGVGLVLNGAALLI